MTTNITKHHTKNPLFFIFTITYFISTINNILKFFILIKYKKLPLQIKILSINIIIPNFLLNNTTNITYNIQYIYPLSTKNTTIYHTIFNTLTTLSILNITTFKINHFLNLKFTLKYQIYTTKKQIITIYIII